VGSAVITGAGSLRAQFMVHAIVRSVDEPVSEHGVRRALQNGLRRLSEWAIDSVAMPPLGTGAGNLDAEESAQTMVTTLLEHMRDAEHPSAVEIRVDSEYEQQAFERALAMHGNASPATDRP
jgi:O-acetyl-ADP-ribose deacetylase (regulator of RNase III)